MNENAQKLLEATQRKGYALVEQWSKKPGKSIRGFDKFNEVNFLEGVEDDNEKVLLAHMYENTHTWLNNLDESTRTLQVGSFEKFVFPILRALMANLVIQDLVTISPLDAPTGLVFYFDALYGSSKGNIRRGDKMFDVRTGPSKDYHFTDEIVDQEHIGTGDGITTQFGGGASAFGYSPIRPGTVRITAGDMTVVDDGNSALTGDVDAGGTNTINYSTGTFDVTFSAPPAGNDRIVVTYEYNSEANEGTPEIDLQLTSAAVTARTNKLRARWSIEAQQDFQSYHGISAEVELVAFMANVIAKELNYKVIRHIRQIASAGSVSWDRTPPAGVPWIWHKESLYDAFVALSNLIFDRTQRASGTYILASTSVCNIIETLTRFKPASKASTSLAGVRKIGSIGEFEVFKDPTYPDNEYQMGHKGSSFLDTGYIFAPYLPVYTTGTTVLDDMIARKGMASRNAQKVVNSLMYATGMVTQSGGEFTPA